MTPEQWRRVGELFHEALDVPARDRDAWADSAAGDTAVRRELLSLLENDRRAGGFVGAEVKCAVASLFDADGEGQRIGPYRLLRQLGRGGMGDVYLAERDDDQYQTKVAIKLVRPGMDTDIILQRFRRERQTLAHLEHPHIARLLDGGTTADGRPYFVMEYISGLPITEYAKAGAPDIRQKLTLFLDVCSAVEYAHQRFIVHRDLKPGNILISDSGAAKLLDFGICKLLRSEVVREETGSGTLAMLTPDYASPEQARGDAVTTASDIYSLGAVLYELLTGQKPHRIDSVAPSAIERAICEVDVVRPSLVPDRALARKLAGDLDNILLHALQKDPRRRYASVEQFSDDLRRYLDHRPLKARPDSLVYRARKFARRQRIWLAAAGLATASLVAATVLSLRESRLSRENLLEVRQLANAFVFDVHDAVRDLPGSTHARQTIVQTGLRYLDRLAAGSRRDAALKTELASAYLRIGDVLGNVTGANLGNTREAMASYTKAMALLESAVALEAGNSAAALARVTALQRIGVLHAYTLNSAAALATLRDAEKLGEELLARNPADPHAAGQLAQVHAAAGDALWTAGAFEASIEEHRKAIALIVRSSTPDLADGTLKQTLAAAHSTIGMDETRLGRLEEALEEYRKALSLLEELTRASPANVSYQRTLMATYSHLGDALANPKWRSLGDPAGGLDAYRRMLAVARRLHESDPDNQRASADYAIALSRVAAVLPGSGSQRLAMLRESLGLLQEIERINPDNVMNRWDLTHGYRLLGDALLASDRGGAFRAYEQCAALAETLIAAGVDLPAPDLVAVRTKLGLMAAQDGGRDTAVAHARRALEISDPAGPYARARSEYIQRFLTPRGSGAMGLVHAAAARIRSSAPDLAAEDRRQARGWLLRSAAAWRALQSDPAFAPSHKQEMQQVERALVEMSKPQ